MSNNQIVQLPPFYPACLPGPFDAARSGEERGVYSPRPQVSTALFRNLQQPHFSTPINTLSACRRGFQKAVYQVPSDARRRYLCPRLYDVNRVPQKLAAPETSEPTDKNVCRRTICISAVGQVSGSAEEARLYVFCSFAQQRFGNFLRYRIFPYRQSLHSHTRHDIRLGDIT